MTKTAALLTLSFALSFLAGCHQDTPTPASVTQTPASPTTAPTPQDCAAIADPAQAEDCRFRAEVLKKRQASKAAPVVKHAPETIQQP
jgi:PBP1b-binding outer membrane lipoprotein LpoB